MKIFTAAPYIYIADHPGGSRNQSGLAYMIRDIVDMLTKQGADVEVITQSIFSPQQTINGWTLLRKTWFDLLTHGKWVYINLAIQLLARQRLSLRSAAKVVMYCLTAGYAEHLIVRRQPDVVHIHGIGLYTLPYLLACVRTRVPFVVTLHGLNSFSQEANATPLERHLERAFLRLAAERNISVTVISTGIKHRVETWLTRECRNLHVIPNAVSSPVASCNTRDDVDRTRDAVQRILCVGSIYALKNQRQVIRAYQALDTTAFAKATELVIIGDGVELPQLQEYVACQQLQHVRFTGRLPKAEMPQQYQSATLLVHASKEEGFGLPMLEAFSYGLPVVAFSDLDAIVDLYDEKCMVLVHERSDTALAEGIATALTRTWDSEYIKQHALHFCVDDIGKRYYRTIATVQAIEIADTDIHHLITRLPAHGSCER